MKLTADWIKNPDVQRLFDAFEEHGYQIYGVGGCVRNALLGKAATDFDMSTSARPDETIKVAEDAGFKSIPTGIDHGTITILVGSNTFEVTSFRKDVETHGRRAVVEFSDDIEDDARRRDFTMNALYVSRDGTVVDPLNGLPDLQLRKVRFIDDANARIQEDYLRILRYFRFHAGYGDLDAGMDAEALAAISANVDGLSLISKERIGAEMKKILSMPDPVQTIATMEVCGVLFHILPGSSARALGPLTLLEDTTGLSPDPMRRLISLGGEATADNLRLSKPEAKRIAHYAKAMSKGATPLQNGYLFGRETALDVALITAASLPMPLAPNTLDDIEKGAAAVFPVKSSDLPAVVTGKAIGDALRAMEQDWVQSNFTKPKAALLSSCSAL